MAKIKVALRVRPRSLREIAAENLVVVGVEDNSAFITDIKVPERPSADSRQRFRQFDFDHAFWLGDDATEGAGQEEVYEEMGTSLEHSILEGYNACLLAYGQSSTGKTHTMLGTKDDPGLILRLCHGLWKKFKAHCSITGKTFRMEVSFMEIYREKVRDLLAPCLSGKPLKLREHPQLGPHVQGLKRIEINESVSILELLWEGEKRRATGATGSNRHSSRSHAIWTIYLTSVRKSGDGTELITRNQAHLVDLAGSERADLATTKHLLAEGKDINRSLVSLGNVISSLAERAQYIPYRDSTLTWFLKDSLGGNATTAIIITASPASSCHAQTLNSVRFAQRARLVENQPKINVTKYEGCSSKVRRANGISTAGLKKDIARLASMIRSAQANGGILRSLTPSNGWNRLIAAIGNWTHLDSEQELETRSLQDQSTSMETLATASMAPVADGEVQVDLKSEAASSSSDVSEANRPQHVFIPMSTSFKCLTWRQEEPQQVSDTATMGNTATKDDILPATLPSLEPKINHLKYLVPVYFPVTRNIETLGRIREKIHGTIEKLQESLEIVPSEVRNRFETAPLIRDKLPTLVNPQPIPHQMTESCSPLFDENRNYVKSVLMKGRKSEFSFNIPNVSEFSPRAQPVTTVYRSTDDDEDTFDSQAGRAYSTFRVGRATQIEDQDDTGIDPGNSYTDSSSYESLQLLKSSRRPPPLKILPRDFTFEGIEQQVATASSGLPADSSDFGRESSSSPEIKLRVDRPSSSRFHKFFQKELTELEHIGSQMKALKEKTERYNRLNPYLAQIENLSQIDHSEPDSALDAEIALTSGWNVQIEFQRVQREMSKINKLLRHGGQPKVTSESSFCSTDSSGSISLQSRRSSTSIPTASDLFPPTPTSKSVPVLTSTPKHASDRPSSSSVHLPPTFWSEFYKQTGPQHGGGDRKCDSEHDFRQNERRHPRWRPFLPKTHSYLCHQNGNVYSPNVYLTPASSCRPLMTCQHALYQPQQVPRQHLQSLSSEGSSPQESSQSGHFGSTELCSCQDSMDSNPSWDTFDLDTPNRSGHHRGNRRNENNEVYLNNMNSRRASIGRYGKY